eukprot:TRINITY_DN6795_c0_g1_i1.p1 TRINITY_DN6795_c0_g1~~TRINITY_DN6795_c0_g1_i1.p1  ORF type:complete len:349 (+),score=21.57 TRINITY_DN6795_c0_g1_i1:85-1047(+)
MVQHQNVGARKSSKHQPSKGQIASNRFVLVVLLFVVMYVVVLLVMFTLNFFEGYGDRQPQQQCEDGRAYDPQVVLLDLDDTLYWSPALSDELNNNVLGYLVHQLQIPEKDAQHIREDLYKKHGTTLSALVALGYDVNVTDYHMRVFQLSYSKYLKIDTAVLEIARKIVLPKFIFTNGNHYHTEKVLQQIGLQIADFDGVISFDSLMGKFVKADGFLDRQEIKDVVCKPKLEAYQQATKEIKRLMGGASVCPQQFVLIDDSQRNIHAAQSMKMQTVLVITYNLLQTYYKLILLNLACAHSGKSLFKLAAQTQQSSTCYTTV